MKKSIKNLGRALTKFEQQNIKGGDQYTCAPQYSQSNCDQYCGNTESTMYYNMRIGNNTLAVQSMCALIDHCGWVYLGPYEQTCGASVN